MMEEKAMNDFARILYMIKLRRLKYLAINLNKICMYVVNKFDNYLFAK